MPVPKKRLGHSDQGHRRSNWKATIPAMSTCSNCGAPRHSHKMCGVCGFYKNRVVSEKYEAAAVASQSHDHGPDHDHADHE